MNKQTVLTIVFAMAFAISLTINIVLWIAWPKESSIPVVDDIATISTTTTTTIIKDQLNIDTPYGVVQFPAAFNDVSYQATEQDGMYTLAFSYLHEEEAVELFAIHFGNEENGTLIGYVNQADVLVPFTVTSADASVDEAWSAEEQEYFKTLMMAVNDVIASVQAWDSYIG